MNQPKIVKAYPPGAQGVDTIFHKRPITEEEKQNTMTEVLRNLNKQDRLNEEIKAFVDEKKGEIKKIALENSSKREMLENGFEGQERECFLFPDQQKGVMNFVDTETDEVLWSRPLLPSEKQLFISNAASN